MNDSTSGRATTRDGTDIRYRLTRGSGAARFVLTHSLAMNGDFWDRVVEPLKAHGDVLVWDCRGHGRSGKPAGPYTAELFADDLADLMTAVGWERAVLGGCSMGGCVSLAFAAAYPGRLAGLALVDTTAWYGPDAPAAWADRAQKALENGLESLVAFQRTRWLGEAFSAAHPEIVDAAVAAFLASDLGAYAESCRMLGEFDKRSALPDIKAPTAILVGAEDYATPPAMAQAMHEAIPGSTLQVVEGARHLTPLERPDLVAAALARLAEMV
jgi:3-oxoadipate enol-lactonase